MNEPSIHGSQWAREEEYRQSVIRKALLLGFSAEEYSEANHLRPFWRFTFEGKQRQQYASLYSAAFDYLRLLGQWELAGRYSG